MIRLNGPNGAVISIVTGAFPSRFPVRPLKPACSVTYTSGHSLGLQTWLFMQSVQEEYFMFQSPFNWISPGKGVNYHRHILNITSVS
jgi:hypothetical protein